MSRYIAPVKPLCVSVGIVKPRKIGGSKQHIHQQRKVANCAQCAHCEYYHHPEKVSVFNCFRKSATVA